MPLLVLLSPRLALAATCNGYDAPVLVGSAAELEVTESSGVARSPSWAGVYFTHDDSGGDPELFAFREDGKAEGSVALTGATAMDWEDLAAGPCPWGGECLFVGDIGDNAEVRKSVAVWVVADPGSTAEAPFVSRWDLVYPDGPHDAEAIAVFPRNGELSVLTKSWGGASRVFRLAAPPADGEVGLLEEVGSFTPPDLGAVTGAAWDDAGDRFVARTYLHAYVWNTDACAPDAHWGRAPDFELAISEVQGEAVTFAFDEGILTTSEGAPMPISKAACQGPAEVEHACDDTGDTGAADTADHPADTGGEEDEPPPAGDGVGGFVAPPARGCGGDAAALLPLCAARRRRRR